MEGLIVVTVVLLWLLIAASGGLKPRRRWTPPPPKYRELGAARVSSVVDGDTVVVLSNGRKETIRLYGIDCPEDGQPWGDIATAGLIKLIGGKWVRMEQFGKDKFGRTLATLFVQAEDPDDWLNVNLRMVTLGHAWVTRAFYDELPDDRKAELNRLERWAQAKRVGLWGRPDPVPPWHWRGER